MIPNTSATALTQVGQIALNVHDLDRAVAFYRDVLGLRFLFRTTDLAFFDCGGVRLMLSPPEGAAFDHPSSILYYRVEDIQAAVTELEGRGARFENRPNLVARTPDHVLWMAFLRDSEGTRWSC